MTMLRRRWLAVECLGLVLPGVLLCLSVQGALLDLSQLRVEPTGSTLLRSAVWLGGCAALVWAGVILRCEWADRPVGPWAVRACCALGLASLLGVFSVTPFEWVAVRLWPVFVLPGMSGLARLVRPGVSPPEAKP